MPSLPKLLAVSDRRLLAPGAWADWCSALAGAGVGGLQVREPDLDDGEQLSLAAEARQAFSPPGRLHVHRRFDIALAAGADAVHLPARGLPTVAVRRAVAGRMLVGRSTHTLDDVRSARDEEADYVIFGPIFDTPSKRGLISPRGLAALAEAAALGLPVIAIGGIDAERVGEVLRQGAAGAAAIRAFVDAAAASEMVAAAREAAA